MKPGARQFAALRNHEDACTEECVRARSSLPSAKTGDAVRRRVEQLHVGDCLHTWEMRVRRRGTLRATPKSDHSPGDARAQERHGPYPLTAPAASPLTR